MIASELMELVGVEDAAKRRLLAQGQRLAHYTSAASAYRILTGAQIWLRSAAMINDFSEIRHGLDCLHLAWASSAGQALQAMLERLHSGLRNELAELFDGHALNIRNDTYVTSLSEHDNTEDQLGRLSMWRAYGGKAGVALVLNPIAFGAKTDAMKVYSAPVFYADPAEFVTWFQTWAGRIITSESTISTLDPEVIRNVLFLMFRVFAMCTKHPGFAEEREWRIFTSPVHEDVSPWIEYGTEIINDVPQSVAKLKLFDVEALGISGVKPQLLLNRLIVGPCEYPLQVRAAMRDAMERAAVEDVDNKLWMSLIPLRHS